MQIRSRPLALAAALTLGGAAAAAPLASGGDRHAKAQLHDQQGNVVGVVHLNEHGGEVVVRAEASGITAGFHGFHIHQRGECTGTFTGAGGHLDLGGGTHGAHAGDLPPLLAAADGSAEMRISSDRLSLADLDDADGSAFIVHAGPDNLAHVPARYHQHADDIFGADAATRATGDAGARIACGTVRFDARG